MWQIKNLVAGRAPSPRKGTRGAIGATCWACLRGPTGEDGVENSRLMIADFKIVLSPVVVLVEFAHGASFELLLRKSKKTQG